MTGENGTFPPPCFLVAPTNVAARLTDCSSPVDLSSVVLVRTVFDQDHERLSPIESLLLEFIRSGSTKSGVLFHDVIEAHFPGADSNVSFEDVREVRLEEVLGETDNTFAACEVIFAKMIPPMRAVHVDKALRYAARAKGSVPPTLFLVLGGRWRPVDGEEVAVYLSLRSNGYRDVGLLRESEDRLSKYTVLVEPVGQT